MSVFAPDGGLPEGPGYWDCATVYNALYLDALKSALVEDFGLSRSTGFSETGAFRIQAVGPLDKTFNFAYVRPAVERAAVDSSQISLGRVSRDVQQRPSSSMA